MQLFFEAALNILASGPEECITLLVATAERCATDILITLSREDKSDCLFFFCWSGVAVHGSLESIFKSEKAVRGEEGVTNMQLLISVGGTKSEG